MNTTSVSGNTALASKNPNYLSSLTTRENIFSETKKKPYFSKLWKTVKETLNFRGLTKKGLYNLNKNRKTNINTNSNCTFVTKSIETNMSNLSNDDRILNSLLENYKNAVAQNDFSQIINKLESMPNNFDNYKNFIDRYDLCVKNISKKSYSQKFIDLKQQMINFKNTYKSVNKLYNKLFLSYKKDIQRYQNQQNREQAREQTRLKILKVGRIKTVTECGESIYDLIQEIIKVQEDLEINIRKLDHMLSQEEDMKKKPVVFFAVKSSLSEFNTKYKYYQPNNNDIKRLKMCVHYYRSYFNENDINTKRQVPILNLIKTMDQLNLIRTMDDLYKEAYDKYNKLVKIISKQEKIHEKNFEKYRHIKTKQRTKLGTTPRIVLSPNLGNSSTTNPVQTEPQTEPRIALNSVNLRDSSTTNKVRSYIDERKNYTDTIMSLNKELKNLYSLYVQNRNNESATEFNLLKEQREKLIHNLKESISDFLSFSKTVKITDNLKEHFKLNESEYDFEFDKTDNFNEDEFKTAIAFGITLSEPINQNFSTEEIRLVQPTSQNSIESNL
jgi:hypothetical protein